MNLMTTFENVTTTPLPKLSVPYNLFGSDAPSMTKEKSFTPWYKLIDNVEPTLNNEATERLAMLNRIPFQDSIANNFEFWADLCEWGLNTNVLHEGDVGDLIEAEIGSIKQIQSAQKMGGKILSVYQEHSVLHEEKIQRTLNVFKAEHSIRYDIQQWKKSGEDSAWSFDLTISDGDYYGEGYNEQNDTYGGTAIRIESPSELCTLPFDLGKLGKEVGTLFYHTICMLSRFGLKTNAIDLCESWDEQTDVIKCFKEHNVSEQMIAELYEIQPYALEEELAKLDPKLHKILMNSFEEDIISNAINLHVDVYSQPWFEPDPYLQNTTTATVEIILGKLNLLDKEKLNKYEKVAYSSLNAVLNTVKHLVVQEPTESPWIDGSDRPLCTSAFVSFGSSTEHYHLDMENEHIQSVCEVAAIKLNLSHNNKGFETIENIILADQCLMLLASVPSDLHDLETMVK